MSSSVLTEALSSIVEDCWIDQRASANELLRTAWLPVIASSRRDRVEAVLTSGSADFRSEPEERGA